MNRLGRWLGTSSSLFVIPLWIAFLARVDDSAGDVSGCTTIVVTIMLALAAGGAFFAAVEWLIGMYAVFFASFFPMGLYMLGSEGLSQLIGVCNLIYLAAALLLWFAPRRQWQG